ncbi:hypothetical protein ASF38_02505 [Aeromicrobium sp. Leaf272]|nr:hypothetical protein ASF38_02505 [Aeromicrobium sp. Leaf272]
MGPANMSAKNTASSSPPRSRKGRRRPWGCVEASLMRPAIGLSTTSHAFGRKTITAATTAAMPSVSVRYGRRRSPGTVPKVPVATLPSA